MRAYGGTASEALRKANRREEFPRLRIAVEVFFDQLGTLYRCLDSHGAEQRVEDYTEQGVRVICQMPSEKFDAFEIQLRNATRDQFDLKRF
jgi:putative IMPACT (imprinted ancient) family translation regulator